MVDDTNLRGQLASVGLAQARPNKPLLFITTNLIPKSCRSTAQKILLEVHQTFLLCPLTKRKKSAETKLRLSYYANPTSN